MINSRLGVRAVQSLRFASRARYPLFLLASSTQWQRGISRPYSQAAAQTRVQESVSSSTGSQPFFAKMTSKSGKDEPNQGLALHVNGKEYYFDSLFLRDACNCSQCVDPYSRQKSFYTAEIPPDIAIESTSLEPDGSVRLRWHNDMDQFRDTNHSTIMSPLFLANLIERAGAPEPRALQFWSGEEFTKKFHLIDYNDFMTRKDVFRGAVEELNQLGLIFLTNVPESEKSVEHIGEKIGPLRDSFYGRTWDVRDKPQAENVAYTSKYLGLHMDLLYMKNPPGLQLLHCLHASPTGGISLFADSFAAAAALESASPAAFAALASVPVTYHYRGTAPHTYTDSKPTIELAPSATSLPPGARAASIRHVNYSPPFQAPFAAAAPGTSDGAAALRAYHAGVRAFAALVDAPEGQFRRRMLEGECVVFDNRRVLHGRTGFVSGGGGGRPRWLKGAYVDGEVFESCLAQVRGTSRDDVGG